MPLHSGHLALIEYGLENCKKVTILLVAASGEPIDPELRYSWLIEHYKNNPNIEVNVICRDFINALPQEKRTGAWCETIKVEYPGIDAIVSSEKYGDVLASYLGITHLKFDHKREIIPISATEIRENLRENIHFLPDSVRKHFKMS